MNNNNKNLICPSSETKLKRKRMSAEESKKIKSEVMRYLKERLDSGSDIDNKVVFSLFYPVKESTLRDWIYEVKPNNRWIIMWEIRELLIRNKSIDNKIIYAKYWKIKNRTLLRWINIIKKELEKK